MFVIKYKNIFLAISMLIVGASVLATIIFGVRIGIDFKGGSQLEVSYPEVRPEQSRVEATVAKTGLTPVHVQSVGEKGYSIKTQAIDETQHEALLAALGVDGSKVEEVSFNSIGPSLGTQAVKAGVMAGLIGLLAIIGFLILWYRLPGIIASVSLIVYAVIVLSIFKLFGVVLSAAGIAGFIISIGTAVDANILIFERMKEEVRSGRGIADSMRAGFDRAWSSIYDSNFTTLGTAVILFSLGVSVIKGFALTLIIGILASLFSAYVVTRIFLYAFGSPKTNKITGFLFGSGLSSARGK